MPTDLRKNPWLGIEPGLLRHRVNIEEAVETQDNSGFPVPAWIVLWAIVKANVEPLSGQELFEARQLHAEVTHKITLRFLPLLTPKHRIVFGARTFDILAVLNLEERNLLTEIMAKERV